MNAAVDRARAWAHGHAADVAKPGASDTWSRLVTLMALGAEDLSFARLTEGHLDALAILAEAGALPVPGALYGVWAARSGGKDLAAEPAGEAWVLSGEKAFCSGADHIDRALVTADTSAGPQIFDVDLRAGTVSAHAGTWPAVGMAASESMAVRFEQARADRAVGGPGFYTGRPGFWWGAVGVAACWYGGAAGLVDALGAALAAGSPADTELAPYGAAVARCGAMRATLQWAAARIDESDEIEAAHLTALVSRDAVHAGCTEVLALAAAAGGARPICLDPAQSRRSADLYAYLAQHHPGRDAAELARRQLGGGIDLLRPAPASARA